MDTEHKEYVKQEWERVNSLVDTLTLFDDELMARVFDRNAEATELVLRLILGRNIKVISLAIGQPQNQLPAQKAVHKSENVRIAVQLKARAYQLRVTQKLLTRRSWLPAQQTAKPRVHIAQFAALLSRHRQR